MGLYGEIRGIPQKIARRRTGDKYRDYNRGADPVNFARSILPLSETAATIPPDIKRAAHVSSRGGVSGRPVFGAGVGYRRPAIGGSADDPC